MIAETRGMPCTDSPKAGKQPKSDLDCGKPITNGSRGATEARRMEAKRQGGKKDRRRRKQRRRRRCRRLRMLRMRKRTSVRNE
jgi:hypothetical protein